MVASVEERFGEFAVSKIRDAFRGVPLSGESLGGRFLVQPCWIDFNRERIGWVASRQRSEKLLANRLHTN